MIETKAASSMSDPDVLAKQVAGAEWCANASHYAKQYGGKAWKYLLIPHDVVAENMTLDGLTQRYAVRA
jgi:type III restriction enzyme